MKKSINIKEAFHWPNPKQMFPALKLFSFSYERMPSQSIDI